MLSLPNQETAFIDPFETGAVSHRKTPSAGQGRMRLCLEDDSFTANKSTILFSLQGLVIGRWGHVITYMIVVQQELLNATTFLVHRTPTNAAVTKYEFKQI